MTRHLLRPVHAGEIDLVYRWRNHPRVRAVMPFSDEIDYAYHREWWPQALADRERRMFILEDDALPVAMLVFLNVRPGKSATWGFYTAPHEDITQARAVAAWKVCDHAGLRYPFDYLHVESLHCQIHERNKLLPIRERMGFRRTGAQGPFVQFEMPRAYFEANRDANRFRLRSTLAIRPDPRDLGRRPPRYPLLPVWLELPIDPKLA